MNNPAFPAAGKDRPVISFGIGCYNSQITMKTTYKGWRYPARLLLATFLSLVLALAVTMLWFSYRQAMSYVHPVRGYATGKMLKTNGIDYQEIELITEDGLKLSAWYTPPNATRGAVILVAHGYGDKRAEVFHLLFASHGYGVLAWDFRAHGNSEGDFTSLGYYETMDAKAALDFALAQPGVQHIGAWGGSMGAVTMIRAAAQYPEIEALVADSPFSTLEDEMELRVPIPVMRSLIRVFAGWETGVSPELVRPVDDIGRISPRPVFIIQSMDDGMVPLDSAQRLFDAAGEPRQLWTESGAPHMNMYAYYKTRYTKQVIKFFNNYLPGE